MKRSNVSHMADDPASATESPGKWWQRGVVYQVYPLSFADSNDDGKGDLAGIRSRLDYLVWLGVDAVWISPFYPSPMADFGYDVLDYEGVDPQFGTLAEFDALLADAHRLGLRVILDFIPNHSSDRHPWFIESASSRSSDKRDWYIWCDPAPDGGPPSNWLSEFGGSAWQLDAATAQYYYHAFLREQPDLNWRNPRVREAMYAAMRFWLERGVDGFRIDAIHHLFKDERWLDNPPNPDFREGMSPRRKLLRKYTTNLPEVQDVAREMRALLARYGERVLIGEAWLPFEQLMAYYGRELDCFHLPFNFHLIGARWERDALRAVIDEYESMLPPGAWPNWVLGNHDRSRIAARVGPAQARVAAVLLCTLRGTPTLYYGDELGMTDVPIPPEAVQDPYEKNVPGLGLGRDPERTPMQWSPGPHAGFSRARPWLPIAENYSVDNVETERRDPGSMLSLYRALLALRRSRATLSIGDYASFDAPPDVLGYLRTHGVRRDAVLLELGGKRTRVPLPAGAERASVLLSTHSSSPAGTAFEAVLEPNEAVVLELEDLR
jgi:alpha-glucosidase